MGDQKCIISSSSVLRKARQAVDPGYVVVSTHQHWARAVSYGPFFLCVIHKEGLCPSRGDINRLMMMKVDLVGIIWQLVLTCHAVVW
jgi:hypothetical protein